MPTVKLTNDDLPPAYNKSLNETTASAQKPSNSGFVKISQFFFFSKKLQFCCVSKYFVFKLK